MANVGVSHRNWNYIIALALLMVITGLSGVYLSNTSSDIPVLEQSQIDQSTSITNPIIPMHSGHDSIDKTFSNTSPSSSSRISTDDRIPNSEQSSSRNDGDWFDPNQWPRDYCPYFENICVHNQHFRVHEKRDEFTLDTKQGKAQKVFGDHMPNIADTLPIYAKIMNATQWNIENNEYQNAHCRYVDGPTNHMILQGYFQAMLGEWVRL